MTRFAAPWIRRYASIAAAIALTSWLPACGGGGAGVGEDDGTGSESGGTDGDADGDDTGGTADGTSDDHGPEGTDSTAGSTGEPSAGGVEIRRDAHGVPHIIADTDAGALYGLGYASAEDRLLQMTVAVLAAQGRLAEFFGDAYVDHDKRFRLMGHWRHAEHMAATIDAEHQALLQAYADGVNAWVAAHPDALNPAFDTLGLPVPEWTAAHSLAVWYRVSDLFTNDPAGKAQGLVEFEAAVADVGLAQAIADATANSNPGDPDAAVVQASDVPQSVQDEIASYAVQMGYGDPQQAIPPVGFAGVAPHDYGHTTPKFSHAWVVGGERTTTGDAVLVSDPQVPVTAPAFLYEWAVVGEEIHARGAGIAGVPGLLIGYTPDVAWGMTAAGLDSRDLFRLQMSDAMHYMLDGEEKALEVETETILIAGGQSREFEYKRSDWGPVITDLIDGATDEYAMKGLPFSATDRDPFVAMVGMMRAHTIDDVRDAIVNWTTPSTNLLVAGPDGDIFFTLLGDIPLRSPASPLGGKIAQDGSESSYDWVDVIPNQYKPWVRDPASGTLLSANHRPVADWYPLPLGLGQGGGGETIRSRRLRELVEALPASVEPRAVVDDIQWDCVNGARRDLVALGAHLVALQPARMSAETIALVDELDAWLAAGGSMRSDQAGVGLADRISVKFREQNIGPELAMQYGGGSTGLSIFLDEMMAAIDADPGYLPSDAVFEYIDGELSAAWDAAEGSNPDPGTWDAAYVAGAATPSFPFLVGFDLQEPGLGPTVQSPTIVCADGNTIWSQRGESYTQFVDLADIDASETILPPGNVEGPDAPLSTSQLDAWAEGSLKTTALSVEAIEALGEPEVLTAP